MKHFPRIGFIAEGPTDFAVLENILIGFFDDYDMSSFITELQPQYDNTEGAYRSGGWTRVLEYCCSSRFRDAFDALDYIVVQIDTDRLFEKPFELDLRQPVEALVDQVTEKLISAITEAFGSDFLQQFRNKILFAVSVDEISCWLLPLYFTDKTAGKTKNCLADIQHELRKRKKQGLEKNKKSYDKASLAFCKPKVLFPSAEKNPSFKIFVDKLKFTLLKYS